MPGVTKEQIEQAKKWDLLSYLQAYEPNELKKCSPHEYCTATHDSLKISKGLWCWNSAGIGGKTALDFLIKVRGLDFVGAVETLCGECGAAQWKPPSSVPKPDPPKPFLLPEASRCGAAMVSYLQDRGIDPDIISQCIGAGILYESRRYQNCVFVGKDLEGKARFASLRGTHDGFRMDVEGSNKQYSFVLPAADPESQFLAVTESPIDALSLATVLKMQGDDPARYHFLHDVKLTLTKTYEGFSSPTGIAVDSAGNLYVSNWGGSTVTKVDTEGKSSAFVDGLGSPAGLAFDSVGNLYVADYTEDVIYQVNPTSEKTVFAKGLHTPTGISFNKAGDLLVSNRSSDEIVKIDSTGKILPVAQGMKTPVGVAEDADGNLYVTNYGGGIIKVTSAGVVETFSDDFGRPGVGIDISAKNQIFATDNGDGCVRLLSADGSTKIVVDEIGGCVALLVQDSILYVGSWNSGAVYAYTIE